MTRICAAGVGGCRQQGRALCQGLPRPRRAFIHRAVPSNPDEAAILAIERPHPHLWTYYLLSLLVVFPALPVFILPMWFRYHTMRYRFTDEGVSMSWGILFRREVIIQYARIQDIHLRSNFVERWLGLAKVLVQTASGNASAEMTLEGLQEYEAVRDFLYSKMRGVRNPARGPAAPLAIRNTAATELAAALRETARELRALRESRSHGERNPPENRPHV